MKILFLSHASIQYDGRLRELMKVSSQLGETEFIVKNLDDNDRFTQRAINRSYSFFIFYSLYRYLRNRKLDVVFIDNRKASVVGLIIKILFRPKKLVQDVRELYLPDKEAHLSRKVGNFFESKLIKKANVLIAANRQRAQIMQDVYKLKELPLVYENLRQLKYDEKINFQELDEKYKHIFSNNTFKIITTSGHVISRTNDQLVKAMNELGDDFELLMVGGGSNKDKEIIKEIIKDNHLTQVHILGLVNENELKYLVEKSDLGIVNYHDKDLNNKYCASGKIYEYVYEGVPVLTTENEPLKELVDQFNIGISNNDYVKGVLDVKNNYETYKSNTIEMANHLSVEENNMKLVEDIKSRLKEQ